MKEFFGPLISGLALSWTIYSFFAKKREEQAAEDRKSFIIQNHATKEFLEAKVKALELKLEEQSKSFNLLRVAIVSSVEKSKTQYQYIEKVLDRHEKKLDEHGKVIVKD